MKQPEKHCLFSTCVFLLLYLFSAIACNLVIVEKMFSTEPIVAFLDLCSCYIFLVTFVS